MEGSVNRLVTISKDILRLLLGAGTNVNQIVRQTSSDRTYVLNVIKILEQEGLVSESTDPKHKQKKIKNLTAFGLEIAELVKSIDQYSKSWNKLEQSMERYFNAVRSKKTELNRLKFRSIGIAILEYETADYIKDFAIFTYSSIFRSFGHMSHTLDPESGQYTHLRSLPNTTRLILNQIIRSIIDRQIDTMLNNPLELIDEFNEYSLRITELCEKMVDHDILNNEFISKEAKDVLLSAAFILRSQKPHIKSHMDFKNSFWQLEKELNSLKAVVNKMPEPKEDPKKLAVKAFYKEILKALS